MPEETDELLQRVDQPLKEDTDTETVSNICYVKAASNRSVFTMRFAFFVCRVESSSYVTTTVMAIRSGLLRRTL